MFQEYRKLPCRHWGQKKTWMDSTLFEEWVRELDKQFEKENREVALIIDNCIVHPEICGLKAIDLFFLPSNTTSVLQSVDQEVICSLKARGRTKVVQKWYVDELFDDSWHCRAARADGKSLKISGTGNEKLCKTKKDNWLLFY